MDWIKVGTAALLGGVAAAVVTALLVIFFGSTGKDSTGGGCETFPAGAVVAFDQEGACPAGWARYDKAASRAIIGAAGDTAGTGDDGAPLTAHKHGTAGGQETVTLTADNLPPHTHAYNDIFYSEIGGTVAVPNNKGSNGSDNDNKGYEINRTTLPDQRTASPVRIMPPFLALTYCVKS